MDLGYNYRGYAVNSIYVNVSSPSSGQVDLLVNGRVVDSITTYGSDVYLFPSFERYLYSDITYLQLGISGRVFIRSIEVKLQDRY